MPKATHLPTRQSSAEDEVRRAEGLEQIHPSNAVPPHDQAALADAQGGA